MSDTFEANSSVASKKFIGTQGIVDATGTCELDVPVASVGKYQTGSITVYDSPVVALWTVYFNGIPVDVTTGISSTKGQQIGPNDLLVLKATNLQGYIGQTYHATFTCIETPADNTDLVIPEHDHLAPPPTANILYSPFNTAGVQQLITVPNSGTGTTGFLPTAGYGSVLIYVIQNAIKNAQFFVTWYAQIPTGLIQIGNAQTFYKGGSGQTTPVPTEMVIPVQGPFVTVTCLDLSGTGSQFACLVMGVPPGIPNLLPPQTIINAQGQAFPANGNSTIVYPGGLGGANAQIVPGHYKYYSTEAGTAIGGIDYRVQQWNGTTWYDQMISAYIATNSVGIVSGGGDVVLDGSDVRSFVSNTATTTGTCSFVVAGPMA